MYVASVISVRARKQHVCCECNGTIYEGQYHELITAKKEGFWGRYRTHDTCSRLRKALREEEKEKAPVGELYTVIDRLAETRGLMVEDGIMYKRVRDS